MKKQTETPIGYPSPKKQEKVEVLPAVKEKAEIDLPQPSEQQTSIQQILLKAIEHKTPIDVMERLLAMQERIEAERSRKLYFEAMSALQRECPIILKTKKVVIDGAVRYAYAPLDEIQKQLDGLIGKHGFSYRFDTKVEAGNPPMFVTHCIVSHIFGHTETNEFKVPADPGGKMNAIQEFGAANTYSKRYAFCNAFGILTSEEDTDANIPPKQKSQPQQPKPKAPPDSVKDGSADNTQWFDFLKSCEQLKKSMDQQLYYNILGSFGYAHANEVRRDRKHMIEVYSALRDANSPTAKSASAEQKEDGWVFGWVFEEIVSDAEYKKRGQYEWWEVSTSSGKTYSIFEAELAQEIDARREQTLQLKVKKSPKGYWVIEDFRSPKGHIDGIQMPAPEQKKVGELVEGPFITEDQGVAFWRLVQGAKKRKEEEVRALFTRMGFDSVGQIPVAWYQYFCNWAIGTLDLTGLLSKLFNAAAKEFPK